MPSTDNGIVYHYCSLEAFKSIIENECLWLCDIRKSNDSQECVYFDQIMSKTIQQRIDDLQNKSQTDPSDLADLQKMREGLNVLNFEQIPTYVCSLSHDGDLLSQWRGYADDGYGIALGFDLYMLQNKYNTLDAYCLCEDVFYGSKEEIATQCIQYMSSSLSTAQILKIPSSLSMVTAANILLKRPFYKSNAFREENEFRIVLLQESPSERKSELPFSERKYRITNHQLSSYYEFSFSSVKDEFLREIHLGPKCKVTPDDVRMFLKDCGYQSDNINIVRSEATYR